MSEQTDFRPTNEMITTALEIFRAKATIRVLKPIVNEYHRRALRVIGAQNDDGEIITDPEHAWTICDEQAQTYYDLLDQYKAVAGFDLPPGYCPLLIIEDVKRRAERRLMGLMEPITHIPTTEIIRLEDRKQYLDLTLRLLAPFVEAPRRT